MAKSKEKTTNNDEPRYTADAVIRSGLYEPWLVRTCLKRGETYTAEEIEKIITKFTKGAK